MKICIVTHNVRKGDGQGRVNYEVTYEALRKGHKITLVAASVAPELLEQPNLRWVKIHSQLVPIAFFEIFLFAFQSACWILLHRNEFDLIQTNGAATAVRADVNAVHFVHSAWMKSPHNTEQYQRSVRGVYKWLYTCVNSYCEKKSFHSSAYLIAVSEKIKKELIDIGVNSSKIKVIFNGVELEEFHPSKQKERAAFSLPSGYPLALFVGDIRTKRKNLDTVLKALVEVSELHLAVAGDTSRSPFLAMAEELGLLERVHFLGFRHDIPELMRSADFFVFPSRYEPFGMVISEAMATALPVITTVTTGGAELIDKDCGVLIHDPESVTELADALSILTYDIERRSSMGIRARVIAQDYSWQIVASDYVQLFENIGKQHSK